VPPYGSVDLIIRSSNFDQTLWSDATQICDTLSSEKVGRVGSRRPGRVSVIRGSIPQLEFGKSWSCGQQKALGVLPISNAKTPEGWTKKSEPPTKT
jgi:hypothetical protein